MGGEFYQEPIVFDYMRDTFMKLARKAIIAVEPHRCARFVKVVLFNSPVH